MLTLGVYVNVTIYVYIYIAYMDPMGFVIVFGLAFFAVARLTGKAGWDSTVPAKIQNKCIQMWCEAQTACWTMNHEHGEIHKWIWIKSFGCQWGCVRCLQMGCLHSTHDLSVATLCHTTYDDHMATWNGELTNYLIRCLQKMLATHVEEMAGSDYCQPGGVICVTKNVNAVGKSMNMEFPWVLENVENWKT